MKKILVGVAVALALVTSNAAADGIDKRPSYIAAPAPIYAPTWSGFYIGAGVGAGTVLHDVSVNDEIFNERLFDFRGGLLAKLHVLRRRVLVARRCDDGLRAKRDDRHQHADDGKDASTRCVHGGLLSLGLEAHGRAEREREERFCWQTDASTNVIVRAAMLTTRPDIRIPLCRTNVSADERAASDITQIPTAAAVTICLIEYFLWRATRRSRNGDQPQ